MSLGISMPTTFLPGIIATLADIALIFLAMSSDKEIILEALIPGAGWSSYIVTIGPGDILIISPSILKSVSTFFNISELALSSCSLIGGEIFLSGCDRKSTEGDL